MFTPVTFRGRLFRKYLKMWPHPAKIRLQNIAGKKFFRGGIEIKNNAGVVFTLDANDWITRIMLMEGDYETASTTLAKKLLSDGGLFMDIGANFGLFTCIVAHNNEKLKVIAIEPNHSVVSRLLNNIRCNALQERVRVLNTAVSKKNQFVTLSQPAPDNLGTTLTTAGTQGLLSILSCPLQWICTENKISVIDLVKIDIEGNEFEILEDFPFEKITIKNIILEFNHLSKVGFIALHSFFLAKGFKIYTITGEELLSDKQPVPENNIWIKNQRV